MVANQPTATEERINRGASALNRKALASRQVFAVTLFGGPGCGKTSLLEATLKRLGDRVQVAVILGNLQAEKDAQRLAKYCDQIVPVETIDLTPELVREALLHIDLSAADLILIERAAEAPPYPWDLGQSATVGMFSLADGDDKARRHTERIEHADLLLLSKIDLLPWMPFDIDEFRDSVRFVNSSVPTFGVSVVTGQGMDAWCDWLLSHVKRPQFDYQASMFDGSEYYIG